MTRGQKIALVAGLLLLLALAAWLSLRTAPAPRCSGGQRCSDNSPNIQPDAWMASLGGLLESPDNKARVDKGPKLRVPAGSSESFKVSAEPDADTDRELRTLKLRLASGGPVSLNFKNLRPLSDPDLNKQEKTTNLPDPDRRDPKAISYAVGKAGGSLSVNCDSQSACELTVE